MSEEIYLTKDELLNKYNNIDIKIFKAIIQNIKDGKKLKMINGKITPLYLESKIKEEIDKILAPIDIKAKQNYNNNVKKAFNQNKQKPQNNKKEKKKPATYKTEKAQKTANQIELLKNSLFSFCRNEKINHNFKTLLRIKEDILESELLLDEEKKALKDIYMLVDKLQDIINMFETKENFFKNLQYQFYLREKQEDKEFDG